MSQEVQNMKITLIQPVLRARDYESNVAEIERLMSLAPKSDVYVLPEMWATGFDVYPTEKTRSAGREALAWMHRQADVRQCAVVGSLAVDESVDDWGAELSLGWRNRLYFVMPGGERAVYDKVHLFTLSDEPLSYVSGKTRGQVEWRGVTFCLQICFDLRFPESARQVEGTSYDVLINVANWPSSRQSARDILLRARAIENQAFVVGVNCVGCCGKLVYPGRSVVVNPEGHIVADAGDEAGFATFEPDLGSMYRLRQEFPVGIGESLL